MMFRQLSKMATVRLAVPLQVIISALFIVTVNTECITPRNTSGTCVVVHKCPVILNILTNNPLVPELVSSLQKYNCGYEGNMPRVCCEKDAEPCTLAGKTAGVCVPLKNCNMLMQYLEKKPLLSDTTVDILRQSECQTRDDFMARVCCPIMPSNEKLTAVPEELPKVGQCGVQGNEYKLFGGQKADIYEFPWMALLEYGDFDDSQLGCGGSLITSRHVLTAAHCVTGAQATRLGNLKRVRLGEYNINNKTDCVYNFGVPDCTEPIERVDVEKVILHEGFAYRNLDRVHDIALIKLKRSFKFTDFVRPICLPTTEFNLPTKFVVSGWGQTETEKRSNEKLKLDLPIYNKEMCRQIYSKLPLPSNLGSGQICAGGELGKDTCTGDSGGPLMSAVKGGPEGYIWYQLGVVSFGPTPCGRIQPGVYTLVTEYLPWIYENLKK